MRIAVDAGLALPVYEQIVEQVTAQVAAGVLAAGEKLPPVRTLAADLGLAVNTVAKAYRTLEASGLVETRGRAGTVVMGAGAERAARQAAAAYAAVVRELGLGRAEALDLVARALD